MKLIIIFKNINSPLNLTLTCRHLSIVAKYSYAKIEWLITRHGKAYALLLHAVRLGSTFINIQVCQILIARNIEIIPEYPSKNGYENNKFYSDGFLRYYYIYIIFTFYIIKIF
jgi:hypothetical protein